MEVLGLDHIDLTVTDLERAIDFYQTVLGAPAEYPEYGPDYYAVFFTDPDGMKLELVHFPWGYWRRVQQDGHDGRARSTRS